MNLEKWLLEKYGPTMTLEQVGGCLHQEIGTIYNQISAQRFPIKTWREGKQRLASTEHVAQYIESQVKAAS